MSCSVKPELTIEISLEKNDILTLQQTDKFINEADINCKNTILNLQKMIDRNNRLTIEYFKKDCGRIYGKPDIGLIWRPIKQTLFYENYVDIDIQNCHLSIILDICDKHKITFAKDWSNNMIEKFYHDRDIEIKKIMELYNVNRDQVKQLISSIINGGSFKSWLDNNAIGEFKKKEISTELFKFRSELILIRSKILQCDAFANIVSKTKKESVGENCEFGSSDDEKNFEKSAFSRILFHLENEFLQKALKIIGTNDYIPQFDGFYLNKKYFNETLLDNINNQMNSRYIRFIQKEMNEFIDLSELKKYPLKLLEDFELSNIADYIGSNIKMISHDSHFYVYNGVYWEIDNANCHYPLIRKFYCDGLYIDLLFYVENTFKKMFDAVVVNEQIPKIRKKRKFNEKDNHEENEQNKYLEKLKNHKLKFIRELKKTREGIGFSNLIKILISKNYNSSVQFDTNPNLFAFNNRIYDLKNMCWQETPDSKDMVHMTCGYNYIEDTELEKHKYELTQMFKEILPDEKDLENMLKFISTGLLGENQKCFCIVTGSGGNGKTTFQEFSKKTFGKYFYILSTTNLQEKKQSGADQCLASINKKRLIVCSEPEKDKKLKSSTIKELTGNQEISARAIYSSNCIQINHGTYYLECNQMPVFDSSDKALARRLLVIPFTQSFISSEALEKLKIQHSDSVDYEKIINSYKIIDEKYKEYDFQEKRKIAFFHILTEYLVKFRENPYFSPKEDSTSQIMTSQHLQDGNTFIEYFFQNYKKLDKSQMDNLELRFGNGKHKDYADQCTVQLTKTLYRDYINEYNLDSRIITFEIFIENIRVSIELKDFFKHKRSRVKTYQIGTPYIFQHTAIDNPFWKEEKKEK